MKITIASNERATNHTVIKFNSFEIFNKKYSEMKKI